MNRLVISLIIVLISFPVLAGVVNVEDNIGGLYELEELDEGIKVFSDRDHVFNTVPEKFIGATYIRCPVQRVREIPINDLYTLVENYPNYHSQEDTNFSEKGRKARENRWLK